jgi:predicted CoA-substrate-specific enzyme activase
MKLGLDFGSQNLHCAVLEENTVLYHRTLAHNGNIHQAYQILLDDISQCINLDTIETYGLTGNIDLSRKNVIHPILTSVAANKFLKQPVQNVLSIGCENFYLLKLDDKLNYAEHIINSDCASGTGSFLDQQAKRLDLTIDDFAQQAHAFTGQSPVIATRCAVFAKSDIIHSQAEGFSKEAICAGICEGIVRSVLTQVLNGRKIQGPLLFVGGVSLNKKIVEEIEQQFQQQVLVTNFGPTFHAIGAAILGKENNISHFQFDDLQADTNEAREALTIQLTEYPDFTRDINFVDDNVEVTLYRDLNQPSYEVYMGIDVGSTSTKLVLLDQNNQILAGLYTRTAGAPVTAVEQLFKSVNTIFRGKNLSFKGVATTGSGRTLIKEVIAGDLAINEITAHAKGATFLDPQVDTIIEIGGQDSKFTTIANGYVNHTVMNYVCAAGTGTFIEEQAKKLGIALNDISETALGHRSPLTSDRCTVYMERDINHFLSVGWKKEEIMASVLFSVRDNYLSKVAGRSMVGDHIYFQGATAKNKALVAAFENCLQKPILVSKYCHLTGALGAALSLTEQEVAQSTFRGTAFQCQQHVEECKICANHCQLSVFSIGDTDVAWGMKCGRDYGDKTVGTFKPQSVLEQNYQDAFGCYIPQTIDAPTVGIPASLSMKEYAGMFADFFSRCGLNVKVEENTRNNLAHGKEIACSEFCSPILLMHGLIKSLNENKIDFIFYPALLNDKNDLSDPPTTERLLTKDRENYYCYYSQYGPTIMQNLLTYDLQKDVIAPALNLKNESAESLAKTLAVALERYIPLSQDQVQEHFIEAYNSFQERRLKWRALGHHILQSYTEQMKILILGRPYVIFDATLNNGIPKMLEDLGFDLLYQTMFDNKTDNKGPHSVYLERMHWHFGQEVLRAAELAIKEKNVYPVLITSFRCSPDAYVMTYFKELMEEAHKPYLIIQLDEHNSEVGYQTRIEAGVDAFLNDFKQRRDQQIVLETAAQQLTFETTISQDDIILFPYLSPLLDELLIDAFEAHQYHARILPIDQKIINLGFKYVSGGECLPNVAVAGSLIDFFQRSDTDVSRCVLYLGDSCISCNFHQYASLVKAACKKAGWEDIRIFSPKLGVKNDILPIELSMDMAATSVLGSLLYKLYYRFHPYEQEAGATRIVLDKSLALIKTHLLKQLPLWEKPLQGLADHLSEIYFDRLFKPETLDTVPQRTGSLANHSEPSKRSLADKLKDFIHPSKYMITAAREIRALFESLPLPAKRKPRIGILGDLYVKYNNVLNDDLYDYIEELGGEVLLPSYMETGTHLLDASRRQTGEDAIALAKISMYEQSFEDIFQGLLDGCFEPPFVECVQLMQEYGIEHIIPGETTINVGRLLYYLKYGLVDAVIHVNPILCCPGTVTTSIYRKFQDEFGIPIINLFYDGINRPNKIIAPLFDRLQQENLS